MKYHLVVTTKGQPMARLQQCPGGDAVKGEIISLKPTKFQCYQGRKDHPFECVLALSGYNKNALQGLLSKGRILDIAVYPHAIWVVIFMPGVGIFWRRWKSVNKLDDVSRFDNGGRMKEDSIIAIDGVSKSETLPERAKQKKRHTEKLNKEGIWCKTCKKLRFGSHNKHTRKSLPPRAFDIRGAQQDYTTRLAAPKMMVN